VAERAPRNVPEIRWRVGLSPGQVLDRLRERSDVQVYARERMPDLGDLVPARRFVAEVGSDDFRVCVGGRGADRGGVRGFDAGGGLFQRLYLHGRIEPGVIGSEVVLRFEQGRTPRSWQRWVGFLVTGAAAVAWAFWGASGTFGERLLLSGVFLAFTAPVLVHDLARVLSLRTEKLELYSLVQGLLGPDVLSDGEPAPYRSRLPAG
jgi:hypothetical protein